jgi:D-methionine transport system substrate-binding protein
MKKLLVVLLVLSLGILIVGCGGGGEATSEEETTKLVVGATPVPHAEILEFVKPILAEQGIELEIKEFTDYVQPNQALFDGELDANYFQHLPYLEQFNADNDMDLTYTVSVHFEPMGLFSQSIKSIDEIKDGAKIGVPSDPTNEARALLLLQDNGILKLKDGVELKATKIDIVDNPKNIEIIEMEAAQLATSLPDMTAAVINGNYALDAGMAISDAIVSEGKDSIAAKTFGNILAIRPGDEDRPEIKALSEVLNSDKVRAFIEEKYAESGFVPTF